MTTMTRRSLIAGASGTLALPAIARAASEPELTFYYPVTVSAPMASIIEGYCQQYAKETGVQVKAAYAGTYADALSKTITAIHGGGGPQFAVLLTSEIHSLQALDLIVPLQEIGLDKEAEAWAKSFWPAFMFNAQIGDKTWSVPFQRSTEIMFYNKDAFAKAGLDPEHYPVDWKAQAEAAQKLTSGQGGSQALGIEFAGDIANAHWAFGALCAGNGQALMNPAGTQVYFDAPKTVATLEYWVNLNKTYHAMPPGVTYWATLVNNFVRGDAAIICSSSGNLANIKQNAKFRFGVALPAGNQGPPSTVVGGGSIYIFKNATKAQQQAALRFAQWLTTPERSADWSIRTGYVAVNRAAYDTPAMKAYIATFPEAALPRDFLPVAQGELSTYQNQKVQTLLENQIDAALAGSMSPADALKAAQEQAVSILRPYQNL